MRDELWRTPFPRFVCAQTADFLAYHMLTVAVGWLMYDLTGSALHLGYIGLVQFLPQLLLTFVVGHVADRYDRRKVALMAMGVLFLTTSALAWSILFGTLTEGPLLACAALLGAARSFVHPTMLALMPSLVTQAQLPRCLAISATGRQSGVILGPALGGALYALGPAVVCLACVGAFGVAMTLLFGVRPPAPPQRREVPGLRAAFDGLAYIRRRPELLGAISLDLFSVLLGGATALLPIFARDILDVGPQGLGLLRAAPAAGAVVMSLWLTRWPLGVKDGAKVGRTMFAAVGVFGLATIVFGLSRSFVLSLASLFALGLADMVSVVIRSSLVQLETPDAMRGRVSAVNSVFIGTSNQLGEFESGLTAAWFGAAPAVVLGGVCTLAVAGLWIRLFPELWRRDRLGT